MKSLVSIIIPTYNRAYLIGETLESVLLQTYTNWECLVIDDGSTDNTKEIVAEYIKNDSRFQYHVRPDHLPKGANACRNYGFELSKGLYINWLDSDDLISKNKIEEQLNILLKQDGELATCKWFYFSNNPKEYSGQKDFPVFKSFNLVTNFINALAVSGGFLPSHSYLLKRSLVEKNGCWKESLAINQDGEYFTRIFTIISKVVYTDECFVLYRKDNNNNTSFFNSELKIKHAIYSWILIESYFKIRFGESTRLVVNSKKSLYLRLKGVNEQAIKENSIFFKEVLPDSFIKKIKKLPKRLWVKIRSYQ